MTVFFNHFEIILYLWNISVWYIFLFLFNIFKRLKDKIKFSKINGKIK